MSYSDDRRLLVEIASMYYEEGAKQSEVAKKFNISRSLVSKYLSKARDLGLVEIIIHDDLAHPYRMLEEKIMEQYGMKEVICIAPTGVEMLNKRIGITAAKYLARILQPNQKIGVSAGTVVHEAAMNFSQKNQMENLSFLPLVGGMGQQHMALQANVVCELFAKKCDGRAVELHAPITVDSAEAKRVFMEQSFIKNVFDEAKSVDVALVGIGGLPAYSTMTKTYLLADSDHLRTELSERKVTGDICYNFIDKDGQLAECTWNERVLAINLDDLKKIPLRIGVSGGKEKSEGIRAALRGGLVNVLITDEETAKKLLD
ncbi:DeoR family transcriptional regulator [Enterococcus florum]|uniref:DeoR family transcriptional regulator n=1 Tax=Enterococcus florum TaxID=2480627 RepID=A0A4P5P8M5_9ENTE|nr:sugar-binding transcriptional regulator [Enterococcus florum]GCF94395.1 DeoR family transcriptional regulator [Enterococcus florum]